MEQQKSTHRIDGMGRNRGIRVRDPQKESEREKWALIKKELRM